MSHRTIRYNHHNSRPAFAAAEIMGCAIEYLLIIVLVILCVVVPLYAEDGYHQIGEAKFAAYRTVMTGGFGLLFVAFVPYFIFWLREHKKPRLSVTDGFVLAYLILTIISVAAGGFYEDALWGSFGWNMGLMSQLSFVLLYLFVSRFGRYYRVLFAILGLVAGIVYTIGILHRLMFDPIGFYEGLADYQKAQFLSTLGQATWYASFLAVTLPIGVGVFIQSRKRCWRIVSGIYMTLGFCTLVTQNSDSAYFAVAGALLILFMASVTDREKMYRFMGALTLLFACGKIMYFLMQIHPNPDLKADFITRLMWTSPGTWILLAVCFVLMVVLYAMEIRERKGIPGRQYPTGFMKRLGRIVPVAAIVFVAGIVLLICLQTRGVLPEAVSDRLGQVSYFNWDDDWGNGRGRIWRFSAKIYSEESILHKLFGVGPDCFNSYVSAHYLEEEELFWGEKLLTNAHNEWLNILISGGILGAVSYLGIYVTAIKRFFSSKAPDIWSVGIAAACMAYLCYNFFCYQQVLCTPFIFILIGVGEYIERGAVNN